MLIESPVGTILAWVLRVDSDGEAVDLPDGWIRCNGLIIANGSIWAGSQVPDLNGERRFLRGGSEIEMLTLEEDQIMEHEHIFNDPKHSHKYHDKHYDDNGGGKGPQFYDHQVDSFAHPFSGTTDRHQSGVTIKGVKDTDRVGPEENRPINMAVIWIIRVW